MVQSLMAFSGHTSTIGCWAYCVPIRS